MWSATAGHKLGGLEPPRPSRPTIERVAAARRRQHVKAAILEITQPINAALPADRNTALRERLCGESSAKTYGA